MSATITAPRTEPSEIVRAAADGRWEHDRLVDRLRGELPLLWAWTRKEYSVRYRQSVLGIAWSVVQPLATLAIFGGVMAKILHVSTNGVPYVSFAWSGLVPWTFTSAVMLITAQSLINAMPVAGKVYFPREIVPLAQVCAFAIDLLIGTAILIIIVAAQGIGVSYHIVALVPVFAVLIIWVAAGATLVSTITVFLRDLRYVVPLATQLTFIATPIMYSASLYPHRLQWVNSVNPVAVIVTSVRDATVVKVWPDWSTLLLQGAAAVVAFICVLTYVRSVEPRMVDIA